MGEVAKNKPEIKLTIPYIDFVNHSLWSANILKCTNIPNMKYEPSELVDQAQIPSLREITVQPCCYHNLQNL
jgi:hypothetical protein